MRELEIDGRRIADDTPCFVIAEIGHNHQGSVEKAQELFVLAKQAGVDAVKLQKRDNRRLFTRALYDSAYENENSFGPTYGAHREALELDRGAFAALQACARELGLVFFATAFDEASADLLSELDVPAYKIASGDLCNTPLLRHVAAIGKPLIVSTGGATIEDVDRAVETVTAINPQLCLLQCTASYPASVEELELGVIATYRERYPELVVGLSDHQDGIAMAPVAYMLGARVIEKHFTASHTAKGTDHAFSLMPEGMRKLVRDLHRVPAAIGKPLIVSTGGATIEDVDRAVETVTAINPQLCLLQCTASYPASVEELELGVIATYRERYPELVVGLSDHQDGIAMAPVAYMLGARVIEKHFTASHTAKGTDHAFSLMPEGMRKLVRDLHRVPAAIGDGVKRPLPSEEAPLRKMGKQLVAARPLRAGHVLAEGDLVAKSPAEGGLPPYRLDDLVGTRLRRALREDEVVLTTDVATVDALAEASSTAT